MKPRRPLDSAFTGVPERPTVAAFLDHWLAHVAWPRLRFTTARTYASVVAHQLVPVLGRIRVRSLAAADIERAHLVWQRAGVKPSMRRKAVEVLRSALNHAVALALCEANVAKRATVPRKRDRPPTWLDLDQLKRLFADVEHHPLRASYLLGGVLGLRRGEIAGLTWADVDMKRGTITIRWNRVEFERGTRLVEPKTAASRRVLAMPDIIRGALREQLARERGKARRAGVTVRPEDAVLTTRSRRPYWSSYLHTDFKKRLVRLGLPTMRFHDLRHTAASLMLSEGVPPRTVMEMMGHRNLAVTMLVYGHTNLRQQKEAVARMDCALRRWGIS